MIRYAVSWTFRVRVRYQSRSLTQLLQIQKPLDASRTPSATTHRNTLIVLAVVSEAFCATTHPQFDPSIHSRLAGRFYRQVGTGPFEGADPI
jgi:hypothetical protein